MCTLCVLFHASCLLHACRVGLAWGWAMRGRDVVVGGGCPLWAFLCVRVRAGLASSARVQSALALDTPSQCPPPSPPSCATARCVLRRSLCFHAEWHRGRGCKGMRGTRRCLVGVAHTTLRLPCVPSPPPHLPAFPLLLRSGSRTWCRQSSGVRPVPRGSPSPYPLPHPARAGGQGGGVCRCAQLCHGPCGGPDWRRGVRVRQSRHREDRGGGT